jgi:hypothetical protein
MIDPTPEYGPIHTPPTGFRPEDERLAALLAPLDGIELGAYDTRILRWLAGWDWSTAATVASLIHRARAADPLRENK